MAVQSMVMAHLSDAQKKRLIGAPRRRKPYSLDRRRLFTMDGWPVASRGLGDDGDMDTYDINTREKIETESDSDWGALVNKILSTGGQIAPTVIDAYARLKAAKGMSSADIAAQIAAAQARADAVKRGTAEPPGISTTTVAIGAGVVLALIAAIALRRGGRR